MVSRQHLWIATVVLFLAMLAVSPVHAAQRPWIGVYMQDVTASLVEAFDLKTDHGVLINDIAEDSPAEKAGLKPKDIILAWNDATVKDSDQLSELVRASSAGDKATLTIDRGGNTMTLAIEIGERREPSISNYFGGEDDGGDADDWAPRAFRFLDNFKTTGIGVSMQSLSGDLGEYFGVADGKGALITEVIKDTPAEKAGLKVGDVVVAVNNEAVESPGDVSAELRGKDRGEQVELTIVRDKNRQKVSLEVDEIDNFGWSNRGNMPMMQDLFNWDGQGTYHNWNVPQVDQERLQRKMEEMRKRLEEVQKKLETLEKKMQ